MARTASKAPNRDSVTSINDDGSRFMIHPADVRGRFLRWRRMVAYILIIVFIALPWIQIGGHPALFLDVVGQRFHVFGLTFAFQDTWLFFFVLSGTAFTLFFVTALWGRVWCGWTCPQTVYLEHVFRRVERWIDGDATARRRLDAAPWTPAKIARRVFKHATFFLLAFLIAHIFLAYFVSLPGLWERMTQAPLEHWTSFLFVFIFTTLLYGNFAWFREQLCLIICPYGRFQSALIDNHTKNVAYDYQRGEPRGKPRDPTAGDCIDCHRCVQVCPTGIDIRQGLQLECVACTACIDACDAVMDKLDRPRGLIRYASEEELEGRQTRLVRVRTVLYTVLLLIGAGVATTAFRSVDSVFFTPTRMPGSAYYGTETTVRNQFQIRLINRSEEAVRIDLRATAPADAPPLQTAGFAQAIELAPLGETLATFVVQVAREDYTGSFSLTLEAAVDPGLLLLQERVEFLGPDPELLRGSRD